jgi:predicted transcriptional regulator
MIEKVVTAKKETTVEDAVRLMNKHEIGCLVVVENGKPVGIVTERDLLKRVLARSKALRRLKVSEIMSSPLVSAKPIIEIEEATKIMCQKKIKKIPVVEKGKLLGLVTLTDILRIQPQLIKMYKIFSNDLAPRRMKKVFDYYLLVQPKFDTDEAGHLKIPKFKRVPIKRAGAPVRYEAPEPIRARWNSEVKSPKNTK